VHATWHRSAPGRKADDGFYTHRAFAAGRRRIPHVCRHSRGRGRNRLPAVVYKLLQTSARASWIGQIDTALIQIIIAEAIAPMLSTATDRLPWVDYCNEKRAAHPAGADP
jgi:hypothetical protein